MVVFGRFFTSRFRIYIATSSFVFTSRKYNKMPPINDSEVKSWLQRSINTSPFLIFTKTSCPHCVRLKAALTEAELHFAEVEIDRMSNCGQIQDALRDISNIRSVPQVYVRGKFMGGCDDTLKALGAGAIKQQYESVKYDYDMVVIGGGSGGLAASKEAAELGAKVAVLDFVVPTPKGVSWGLGGTCVNVGCIPKKLMHQAAILGHSLEDASQFGWAVEKTATSHSWPKMVENVQNHIGSLNWGYRVALRSKGVDYINSYGKLVDAHTIQCTNRRGEVKSITAETIVLATGERPRYAGVAGDKELCITSDDLFSLPYNPGKTLVIGASYVALECAGFLAALGNDVTVMVRSILLRGFDQEMANKIGDYMEKHQVKFVRECVPKSFKEIKPLQTEKGELGEIEVEGEFIGGSGAKTLFKDTFNTVILAIGRDPCTDKLNLESIDVVKDKAGRIVCSEMEQTNVSNVYAIGDIVSEKLQLTPVAIEAGRNLAHRLYGAGNTLTDYENVATTVFTPLEYGAIGLSEEDAIKKYGQQDIEVYHSYFKPLEWTVAHREDNLCYAKLICVKSLGEKVVGFHVLSPNAGEITQGFAIGFRLGATKKDFDRIIGIHPTCAEIFTTLKVTKSSGRSAETTGC